MIDILAERRFPLEMDCFSYMIRRDLYDGYILTIIYNRPCINKKVWSSHKITDMSIRKSVEYIDIKVLLDNIIESMFYNIKETLERDLSLILNESGREILNIKQIIKEDLLKILK